MIIIRFLQMNQIFKKKPVKSWYAIKLNQAIFSGFTLIPFVSDDQQETAS